MRLQYFAAAFVLHKTTNMKKVLMAGIGIIALVTLMSFGKLADWIAYNSPQGKYKVLMPGAPKVETKKIPSAVGELTMYIAMLESEEGDDNLIYMSAYSEYPTDKINSDMSKESLDKFFNGAAEGGAKNMNGKVKSILPSSFKNYPARVIVTDVNLGGQDFLALQKLILVKNKFYMLQTFTLIDKPDNENAKKFFESFELPAQ